MSSRRLLVAAAAIVVLTTLVSMHTLWPVAGEHRPARNLKLDQAAAPRRVAQGPKVSCPKVFVYNISAVRQHESKLTFLGYGNPIPRGPDTRSWLRDTGQHRLGGILLSRLLRSPRCLTHDVAEAQLFFVPMLHVLHPPPLVSSKVLAEESQVVWSEMPPSMNQILWPLCSRFLYEDWHRTLPHLTTGTRRGTSSSTRSSSKSLASATTCPNSRRSFTAHRTWRCCSRCRG